MRTHSYQQSTPSQKQSQFRLQIRRRHIDKLLRINRQQLHNLSQCEAQQICKRDFIQLRNILSERSQSLFSNQRVMALIKELRDINCNGLALKLYMLTPNLNMLIQLQNANQLDQITQKNLYQILLNISADPHPTSPSSTTPTLSIIPNPQLPSSLFPCLSLYHALTIQKNPYILTLSLKILGNLLQKDNTMNTLHYMITKMKIYQIVLKLLYDRKQMYQFEINKQIIRPVLLWFCNKVIQRVVIYQIMDIQKDWHNFVSSIYLEVLDALRQTQQNEAHNNSNNSYINVHNAHNNKYIPQQPDNPIIPIPHLLLYIKSLLKTTIISLEQPLLHSIQKYFSPYNLYYLDYLNSLTFNTLYVLPQQHLQSLLTCLLQQPNSIVSMSVLRSIRNSLSNCSKDAKIVLKYFIMYADKYQQYCYNSSYGNSNSISNCNEYCNCNEYGYGYGYGNSNSNSDQYYNQYGYKENIQINTLQNRKDRQFNSMFQDNYQKQTDYQQHNQQNQSNNNFINSNSNRVPSLSFLKYFLHFLNRQDTQADMSQIIKIIICNQGGFGIFADGASELAQSPLMLKILIGLGCQVEVQEEQ